MRAACLALSLLALASCKNGSAVLVTVTATGPLTVDALRVTAHAAGRDLDKKITLGEKSIPPDHTFTIELDAGQTGTILVQVDALDAAGTTIATDSASTTIKAGDVTPLSISFRVGTEMTDGGVDLAGVDGAADDLSMSIADMAFVPLTWTESTVGAMQPLRAVWGADSAHIWVSGDSSANTYFSTGDDTWTQYSSNPFYNVHGIWGTDATHAWMVDDNGTVRNINSTGTAWVNPVTVAIGSVFTSVWGTANDNVWVVSAAGGIYRNTTGVNAMANWNPLASFAYGINCVHGAAADDVYLAGGSGNFGRSDGTTTTFHNFGTTDLNGVFAIDGTHIYLVGNAGALGFSAGSGTFTQQTVPVAVATVDLLAVWASSTTDIYVVGKAGTILHSTGDGTWTLQTSPVTDDLLSVWGSGPGNVYISTALDNILHGH